MTCSVKICYPSLWAYFRTAGFNIFLPFLLSVFVDLAKMSKFTYLCRKNLCLKKKNWKRHLNNNQKDNRAGSTDDRLIKRLVVLVVLLMQNRYQQWGDTATEKCGRISRGCRGRRKIRKSRKNEEEIRQDDENEDLKKNCLLVMKMTTCPSYG